MQVRERDDKRVDAGPGLTTWLLLIVLLATGCGRQEVPPLSRATTVEEALSNAESVVSLDLFYRWLPAFPTRALELSHLRHLGLRTCQCGTLPPGIAALTNLVSLDASSAGLTNLSAAVGSLHSLTRLWLNDNALAELPPELGDLRNLEYLNLDRNNLTRLPEGLGRLEHLRWLRINGNRLTALPQDLTGLAKSLTILYLKGNPLPDEEKHRLRSALPECEIVY